MDLDIVLAFDGKCDKTFVFCGLDYRFLRLDLFLKKIKGRFFLSEVCVWKIDWRAPQYPNIVLAVSGMSSHSYESNHSFLSSPGARSKETKQGDCFQIRGVPRSRADSILLELEYG